MGCLVGTRVFGTKGTAYYGKVEFVQKRDKCCVLCVKHKYNEFYKKGHIQIFQITENFEISKKESGKHCLRIKATIQDHEIIALFMIL